MCLSSRKNLCIHKKVSLLDDRESVDSACRSLTASWVREKVKEKNIPSSNGNSVPKMMMQQK
jgi:DNA excision repair protein ERCC-2